MNVTEPSIESIRALHARLAPHLERTPVVRAGDLEDELGDGTSVFAKLEFLQRTGTFKARGALASLMALPEPRRRAGVTACSAGNHAIAVAYAARSVGSTAKVVMINTASPLRIERCRQLGAEVVLVDGVHRAFEEADRISRDEGRELIPPFEGEQIATGTATLGLELCEQLNDFEAVVIPVGGGGLCAGVSSAVRRLNPDCLIVGVEPEGADSLSRSLAAGTPQTLERVDTIADSLGAPFALPYSFEICRRNLDDVVTVSDDMLRAAMTLLHTRMRVAVEPACAASTAALFGPLRERLAGKRVVLVMCGSNIDWDTWRRHVQWT